MTIKALATLLLSLVAIGFAATASAQNSDPNGCHSISYGVGFSCDGPLPGMLCTQVLEKADPHTWGDNYVCSNANLGLKWSSAGPISNMQCTQIIEPSDPHTWNDNYLCLPNNTRYKMIWSYAGRPAGLKCHQWREPADPHTWNDNYLCFTEKLTSASSAKGSKCADENGKCSFSGWRKVYYGHGSNWSVGTFKDGVDCNNTIFGDPIRGTVKSCYVK